MSFDPHYPRALSDAYRGFQALMPPNRVSISQGAHDNLIITQPGIAGGPWSSEETPYMVFPMDSLASRKHEAVVFVGPARSGKTLGLLLGWMAHNIVNDPGDMLFVQMTQAKAREFSKTDVDRALLSPKIAAMKSMKATDSNTHDTLFRHGMWLRIAWSTKGNVAGSTYRYAAITDIDRIENAENVDGEGPLFDLAKKRTTTFMSRGMTLVESSPGKPIADPNWRPATPHEAPPVPGILSLYNRSDRHRWYWRCPDCSSHFEAAPGLALFNLPPEDQLRSEVRTINIPALAEQYNRVVCPCCGSIIAPKWKAMLNKSGIWVPDNVLVDTDGHFVGEPMQSSIRGFWLGGAAATYQSWRSIVEQYLIGLREYELTGSEEKLKTTTNTDQGMPYMPRHLAEAAARASKPQDRAEKTLQRYVVPMSARCLVGSVDVQGGVNSRFVVQLHAVGPHLEQWLVDRFEIKWSKRPGMGTEFAPIDPAKYPEDWDVLTDRLLLATWRTPMAGREIRIRRLVVDSGGEPGVTQNAYAWWRRVRRLGHSARVRLYKGGSEKKQAILKETLVGKSEVSAKDDVPLLHCNPNLLSDTVDSWLRRETHGPGFMHFPASYHATLNPDGWVPEAFFDELEAEVRDEDGVWVQVRKRNETFDLCRMICACALSLGLDKVDWYQPPPWLAPLDQNSDVITSEDRRAMQESAVIAPLEAPVRKVAPRRPRAVPSTYLR